MYYLVDSFLNVLFSGDYEECQKVAEKEYITCWVFGGVSILDQYELDAAYGCAEDQYYLHDDSETSGNFLIDELYIERK